MHVHMCAGLIQVTLNVSAHAWGDLMLILGIFFAHPPPYILRHSLLLLASLLQGSHFCLLRVQITGSQHIHSVFTWVTWVSNSSPQAICLHSPKQSIPKALCVEKKLLHNYTRLSSPQKSPFEYNLAVHMTY